MLADGFTKALQNNAFKAFVLQLGLVETQDRLDKRSLKELDVDEYQEQDS